MTNEYPLRTEIVIKQNNLSYLEHNGNDGIFYDTVPILDNTAKSLNLIAEASKYWTVCATFTFIITQQDQPVPTWDVLKVFVQTVDGQCVDNDDPNIQKSHENEYWKGALDIYPEALQICHALDLEY